MGLSFYGGECDYKSYVRKENPPFATITRHGQIRLNSTLRKLLPSLRRITIAADMEADPQLIVFKLIREDDQARYARRLCSVGRTSLQISARGFLRWIGHDFELIGTKAYPATYDDKSRQIIIRLVR